MRQFLEKCGYPVSAIQVGHYPAQQIDQQSALQTSQKENTDCIPFILRFHSHNHAFKSIILKNFKLLWNDSDTGTIFSQPPLISFKCDKNIDNILVRSSIQTNDQPGTFTCALPQWKTCPLVHYVKKYWDSNDALGLIIASHAPLPMSCFAWLVKDIPW